MGKSITLTPAKSITESFIQDICRRIGDNQRVRRSLPVWGRVHIDRSLPFLCVYRKPVSDKSVGVEKLVMGEASYIIASANRSIQRSLHDLVQSIARTQAAVFGGFMVLEVWEFADDEFSIEGPDYQPYFQIIHPIKTSIVSTIDVLEKELKQVSYRGLCANVDIVADSKVCRKGLAPLVSRAKAAEFGCQILGLRVRPIYRGTLNGEMFPLVRRSLFRKTSTPLKRTFHEFMRVNTTHRPPHYTALGRRSVVKAVWSVDKELAEVANNFDFLLLVTPINTDAAWSEFKRSRFKKEPNLIYRRLPIDPLLAKRKLFTVPIERIEDPVLEELFRSQQTTIDRQLTMLADRGDFRFHYGSVQLYGAVDAELCEISQRILTQYTHRDTRNGDGRFLNAESFAALAQEELRRLKEMYPNLSASVMINEAVSGLLVSNGNLMIGRSAQIPVSRAEGLLQHEIGTHVVTYFNGRFQPFQQLYIGLAGYDELQEGLAVLAEYLVGELTRGRLRLLAARVLAAADMLKGAGFIDVFRKLNDSYSFKQRTAFSITTRTFRGGGLTKDAVYLRGLIKLLDYLKTGADYESLFIGKFAFEHISLIEELRRRKVLKPAPLRPAYLTNSVALKRLARVRRGLSVIDLVEEN